MTRKTPQKHSALVPDGAIEIDFATDAKGRKSVENAVAKYAHVNGAHAWRVGKKVYVLIGCKVRNCENQRFTSLQDVFQCWKAGCPSCVEPKAKDTKKSGVRSKKARRPAPKVRKAPKGSPRGRRARSAASAAPDSSASSSSTGD